MITTYYFDNTELTEYEKDILLLLLHKKTFDQSLFFKLLNTNTRYISPCVYENLSLSCYAHTQGFGILFDKAFLSALLDIKRNLLPVLPEPRFSAAKLAETLLQDLTDTSQREELISNIAEDIKKYNKGQTRIFFLHTRKNWSNYTDELTKNVKEKNLGSYFTYEKAILEIEYLLKKSHSHSASINDTQSIIDNYALKRIRSIKNWEDFTYKQLLSMRRTYEKLRSFLIYGKAYKKKIPSYCYENYLDCTRLIYDFVECYTDNKLLDIAYYSLDNTYLFYTYIATRHNNKSPYLNSYTIPFENRDIFKDLYYQTTNILLKLLDFTVNYTSPFWESSVEYCVDIFSGYIAELYQKYNEASYSTPFPLSDNCSPSLDEWLLYNALWNNTISVPQQDFINKLNSIAQSLDTQYGLLQLSMELFGIDINSNKDTFNDIIKVINLWEKFIAPDLLINHILKMIYKKKFYSVIPFFSEPTTNTISIPDNIQKKFLETILNNLKDYANFADGRSDSDLWEKGPAANLIYQFIYRNWYGLGKPDIFPKDANSNHAMIKHFLQRHNLTLTHKIMVSDYPWLQYALENLKKTPEAYQCYMKTSIEYNR